MGDKGSKDKGKRKSQRNPSLRQRKIARRNGIVEKSTRHSGPLLSVGVASGGTAFRSDSRIPDTVNGMPKGPLPHRARVLPNGAEYGTSSPFGVIDQVGVSTSILLLKKRRFT